MWRRGEKRFGGWKDVGYRCENDGERFGILGYLLYKYRVEKDRGIGMLNKSEKVKCGGVEKGEKSSGRFLFSF